MAQPVWQMYLQFWQMTPWRSVPRMTEVQNAHLVGMGSVVMEKVWPWLPFSGWGDEITLPPMVTELLREL